MQMTEEAVEGLFAAYDDLAVDIVSSAAPNTDVDLTMSNRQLAENICEAMNWEDFDLLGKYDFEEVNTSENPAAILAHAFVSFLRWRLFSEAQKRGIGDAAFNLRCITYSEFWYIKLVNRWSTLNGGKAKPWVN
ncbi:hypothetical protein RPALISO_113 [Ruegeria phage RpAliso]|nr:hypothetical protein RPALISO_113 [Ruegeria phage RpAliso]